MEQQKSVYETMVAMAAHILSDDFKQWLNEYWYIIDADDMGLWEFEDIMDLYIHGKNSCYYFEKE